MICGENEVGTTEAGSRASSEVGNKVRVVRASELSEMLSQTLNQTLVRWIVDLNFGTDVAAPVLTREFRIEESTISVPDLALLIQSGYTPRKEWIERHFRVELEEKDASGTAPGEEEAVAYDPQKDQDLFGSIFGSGAETSGQPTAGVDAAKGEIQKAANEMDSPPGATPEESQADAISTPSESDQLDAILDGVSESGLTPEESQADVSPESEISDEELSMLLGLTEGDTEEEPVKPFGNERITEDEAVEMDK